jgi:phage major head subunit gpT-like protein
MPAITPAIIRQTQLSVMMAARESFELRNPIAEQLAMTFNVKAKTGRIMWPSVLPQMKQWLTGQDRELSELSGYYTDFVVEKWANGLRIPAEDIEDDQLDMWLTQARSLGEEATRHKLDRILLRLRQGFTRTTYDGQYFFDTDHQDGAGPVNSNRTTAALDGTVIDAAMAAGYAIKDENGRSRSIRYTHIVVPPALRATALDLFQTQKLASGADNRHFGELQVLVSAELSAAAGGSDTAWYLLDLSRNGPKPLIWIRRRDVRFRVLNNPTDYEAFMRDDLLFGADYRGDADLGFWWLAYGSTGV